MAEHGDIRIGISGWTYAPWRGHFFPKGLPQKQELAYASTFFRSLEINGTFYSLQTPATFRFWASQVPEEFVFAVKAPRFITHIKRGRDALVPLANFFASGMLALGPKLGPILWQFPPNFRFDRDRAEAFLALLPHDTETASRLARRHDHRLKARAWLKADSAHDRSGMRSKSAMRASSIRRSSICCAPKTSRSSAPIRSNGRS